MQKLVIKKQLKSDWQFNFLFLFYSSLYVLSSDSGFLKRTNTNTYWY